jgi:hypothetical protein
MISTPKITDILLNSKVPTYLSVQKFAEAKAIFEAGLADKHIWNVDYENAKSTISNVWDKVEEVLSDPLRDFYYPCGGSELFCTWSDTDPRHNLGIAAFSNTPGFLKRMKVVKNAPELAEYIATLTEAAMLAELVKSTKSFIEKGRKPAINPTVIDLTNTGTCPVCGGLYKTNASRKMVHHGFEISGGTGHYYGCRVGSCPGVGFLPYELGTEGCEAYKITLNRKRDELIQSILDLHNQVADEQTEIVRVNGNNEFRKYARGTTRYEHIRTSAISRCTYEQRQVESSIEMMDELIAKWTLKQLPHGEKRV